MDEQKAKFQGNWKCTKCDADITELPFEPTEGRDILCSGCFTPKTRDNQRSPKGPMVEGNWTCAGCGGAITQLPFEPRGDKKIFCLDCWKKNRS